MTDSSGTVCFDADYYPYGQENDYNTSCEPEFRFAGMEYDSETGNYYDHARYYNPRLGRFMSPDPGNAGASPGNPESWDAYSYVMDNPETLTDPSGMAPCTWKNASGCTEAQLAEFNVQTIYNHYDLFDLFEIPVFTSVPVGLVTNSLTGKSLVQWAWQQAGSAAQFYGSAFVGLSDTFTGRVPANSEQGQAMQLGRLFLGMVSPEGEAEDIVEAVTVTPGQEASISRTAAQGGQDAVERALRSYRRRLAEHLSKLDEITGDPGSVEREIRNFRGLVKAAEDWLSRNP